ncbi:hypothetical protein ACHAXT_005930 [Thalassiosira profunda]
MSDDAAGRGAATNSASQPALNPHALASAQDPSEQFEVMAPPPPAFDPYADRPISTRTILSRGEVHKKGLWHCSVHIWIVDVSSSSILLQQRSASKDTFPGRWDISSAGHVEARKSLEETARCELAEELGVEVDVTELQLAFVVPAEQAPMGGCNAYEHVYFLSRDANEKFALGAAEVSAVAWRPVGEVVEALRAGDDSYAPRTAAYVDALEKELGKLLG